MKEEDPIDKIIFVVNGNLEVYTEFEGNEFIVETLVPGTILNYRTIFTDDKMKVSIRSK
jgi:CRP-like cAMP-binding protein